MIINQESTKGRNIYHKKTVMRSKTVSCHKISFRLLCENNGFDFFRFYLYTFESNPMNTVTKKPIDQKNLTKSRNLAKNKEV